MPAAGGNLSSRAIQICIGHWATEGMAQADRQQGDSCALKWLYVSQPAWAVPVGHGRLACGSCAVSQRVSRHQPVRHLLHGELLGVLRPLTCGQAQDCA